MGINLNQLIKSLVRTKEYIKEENNKLDKKFAAEVQAICSLYNGELSAVSLLDQQVGLQDGPIGTVISYMGKTAPRHYLACDGTTYNIIDYPLLADHFKQEFGSVNYFGGDGTDTFAVPDLRGEFLRGSGLNSHAGQGNGSSVGEHQDATVIPNLCIGNAGELIAEVDKDLYPSNADATRHNKSRVRRSTATGSYAVPGDYVNAITVRPTNTSILYCIKADVTYFCNVEAQANVFDTNKPVIIGTYNGTPIYRRVLVFDITPPTISNFYELPFDVERVFSMYGTVETKFNDDLHATCPIRHTEPAGEFNISVYHKTSTNIICLVFGKQWFNHVCAVELVVEYLAK